MYLPPSPPLPPPPPQVLSNLKLPGVLTAPQIAAKLAPVPGFILANESGAALTANTPDGKGMPTVGVFLRKSGAVEFLEKLTKQNPALGASLRIKAVALGELWQKAQKSENKMTLAFIPDLAEVEQAKAFLKQQGKPETGGGVPLFMAELSGKRLLNLTQNGITIIPVFFSRADLAPVLESYNKSRPEGTPEAKVVLTSLEFLLASWARTPDAALKQIQLMVPKVVTDEAKALVGGS